MAQAQPRFIPLTLTLDTRLYDKQVDETAKRTEEKFKARPSSSSPSAQGRREQQAAEQLQRQRSSAMVAEERRVSQAVEQLQRQRSSAMVAEARRADAAVQSLQRQRSSALAAQWQREERDYARQQAQMFRATQEAEGRRLEAHRATGERMKQISVAVAAAVVFTIATIVASSTAAALRMDTLMRSLAAVAGSRQAAEQQFARARGIAKLPGLGIQEAVDGLVKLQAAGAKLELAETTLRRFGNALAIVGKGKAELSGVNEQIAQILGKNKIMAQDIRILSEYVPQLRKAMQGAFGTATPRRSRSAGSEPSSFWRRSTSNSASCPR